jgi:hypothetical protein
VAVSCRPVLPQCRGWRCSTRDGVGTAGMAAQGRWRQRRSVLLVRRHDLALGERGIGVRLPFEGSTVLFRGCCASAVREWVAQCHGADPGLTAQCRTVAGMASPRGLAEQRRDMIPRRVRGMACVDSFLTWAPAGVRALNALVGGAGAGAASPWEPRTRRRLARGGDQPSADLTRGGVQPSSEADLTRGGLKPSSETGFC